MIHGWFGPEDQPFVTGIVRVEEINLTRAVDFLVDTGADFTAYHYVETAIGKDRVQRIITKGRKATVLGLGGDVEFRILPATITFGTSTYSLDLCLGDAYHGDTGREPLPSLLGRDLLERMVYEPGKLQLDLTIRFNKPGTDAISP